MDPTKNFDHLDPKLKETYARVMGTTPPAGVPPQNPAAMPPVADPRLSAPPAVQPVMMNQPQGQFATPVDQSASFAAQPTQGPNPGTGPTVGSMPTDTTAMFSPQTNPSNPSPNINASPANNSFFSNPSPATTDPTQNPVTPTIENASAPVTPTDPIVAPVTPYSPDAQQQYPPQAADQMAQPLPSPSSIAQKGPHETSALLRVLYIIGAVIFFAVYTVFWIKIFNLPFLF